MFVFSGIVGSQLTSSTESFCEATDKFSGDDVDDDDDDDVDNFHLALLFRNIGDSERMDNCLDAAKPSGNVVGVFL